uniref:Golgin subfamily A member 7 n=1 Tax=Nothobranchius furzeri TaxID=105023 RepID=A0A8C6LST6_NOTFU
MWFLTKQFAVRRYFTHCLSALIDLVCGTKRWRTSEFVLASLVFVQTHSLQDLQQPAVSSKVYVQRDYSSGTICKFQTKFPSELESRLDKQQFDETIQTLNNLYAEAEKLGGKSYLEGCLACVTAYTIFLCMETHYEKVLKKIARYIKDQNEKIYAPRGLLLTDPIERGLRVVEVTIFEDRSIGSGR